MISTKLELYAIALMILLLALAGAEFHGRHIQKQLDEDRAAAALLIAQKKADDATAKSLEITQDSAQKIETIRSQHAQELDAVRGSIVGRLCRQPSDSHPVSPASGTPGKPDAAQPGDPITEPAVDPISLVAACRADADSLTGLQEWIRAQQR